MPRQLEDRQLSTSHTPALDDPLPGSLYIGEPQPGNQYRVFMIFDGFGIHAKLVAAVHPDPETGQLTMTSTDLPQVPFEEFDLHLFASDRGLIATPTHCRDLQGRLDSSCPGTTSLAPQHSTPILSITAGPNGTPCPGQVRPFNPRLVAGTSNPLAGDFSAFILKLDRDDGDQFLGDLNFKMPPGFTGNLRGHHLLPGGGDRRRGRTAPAATEQAAPELPGLEPRSAPPTSPPAPAATRSTRSARCTWRARSRARRSRWSRSPRRSPGPTTTGRSSSASRSTSTR